MNFGDNGVSFSFGSLDDVDKSPRDDEYMLRIDHVQMPGD